MTKRADYVKQLKRYGQEVDKRISSLSANLGEQMHKMQVEEEKFAKEYDELSSLDDSSSLLEKVELIDYWKLENNGRTNKKR